MIKVVNCFLFYNELNLLKFKLKELTEVVDYFILVESKYTFSGNEKPLHYNDNKHLFTEYNHKIIHIIHDHNASKEYGNAWANENEQRFYSKYGIEQLNLNNDDIIILSDLDEIPDPNTLNEYKKTGLENKVYCLEQDMYYYNIHNKLEQKWYQSKMINYQVYLTHCDTIQTVNDLIRPPNCEFQISGCTIVERGGWHLSYFFGVDKIKNKLKNFAHQELSHFADQDDKIFEYAIQNNLDLFNRDHCKIKFIAVEDNNYLPINYKCLIDNCDNIV